MDEHVSWLLRALTETSLVIDALDKAARGLDEAHRHRVEQLAGWAVRSPVAAAEIMAALCDGLQIRFDFVSGIPSRTQLLADLRELIDDLQMRMTSPDEPLPFELPASEQPQEAP